jgi:CheY-like chemotaxis protein
MERRGLVILLLEDQENDVILVRRAAVKVDPNHELRRVGDGEEAVRYLTGAERDGNDFPAPDLIVTDLKMPVMDGLDFLRWRQGNARWKMVPTIVLSGSGLERDIREAYRLGATSYFTKPNEPAELARVLRTIFDYWTTSEQA